MIDHERTNTSKRAREIENDLAKKLDRIAKQVNLSDLLFAHQKYDNLVMVTIQSAIQQIYMLGANYVSRYEGVPLLLTPNDLQTIQAQSRDRFEAFWRAVTRTVIRSDFETQKPLLNRAAMMSALAAVTATAALNTATVQKAKEVDPEAYVIWVTSVDEKVCPICRPLHNKTWRIDDPNLLSPPDDSHINCRCRLLFRTGKETFSH